MIKYQSICKMVLARKIPGTRNFHFDNVNHDDMMGHHYYCDGSYDYYSGYHKLFVCGLFIVIFIFVFFYNWIKAKLIQTNKKHVEYLFKNGKEKKNI